MKGQGLTLGLLLAAFAASVLLSASVEAQRRSKKIPANQRRSTPSPSDEDEDEDETTPQKTTTDPLAKILPHVTFQCTERSEGYYADVNFDCEVFHYCNAQGMLFTFLCPPKSKFNQKNLICDFDRFGKKSCQDSVNYYHLNENLRPKDNKTSSKSVPDSPPGATLVGSTRPVHGSQGSTLQTPEVTSYSQFGAKKPNPTSPQRANGQRPPEKARGEEDGEEETEYPEDTTEDESEEDDFSQAEDRRRETLVHTPPPPVTRVTTPFRPSPSMNDWTPIFPKNPRVNPPQILKHSEEPEPEESLEDQQTLTSYETRRFDSDAGVQQKLRPLVMRNPPLRQSRKLDFPVSTTPFPSTTPTPKNNRPRSKFAVPKLRTKSEMLGTNRLTTTTTTAETPSLANPNAARPIFDDYGYVDNGNYDDYPIETTTTRKTPRRKVKVPRKRPTTTTPATKVQDYDDDYDYGTTTPLPKLRITTRPSARYRPPIKPSVKPASMVVVSSPRPQVQQSAPRIENQRSLSRHSSVKGADLPVPQALVSLESSEDEVATMPPNLEYGARKQTVGPRPRPRTIPKPTPRATPKPTARPTARTTARPRTSPQRTVKKQSSRRMTTTTPVPVYDDAYESNSDESDFQTVPPPPPPTTAKPKPRVKKIRKRPEKPIVHPIGDPFDIPPPAEREAYFQTSISVVSQSPAEHYYQIPSATEDPFSNQPASEEEEDSRTPPPPPPRKPARKQPKTRPTPKPQQYQTTPMPQETYQATPTPADYERPPPGNIQDLIKIFDDNFNTQTDFPVGSPGKNSYPDVFDIQLPPAYPVTPAPPIRYRATLKLRNPTGDRAELVTEPSTSQRGGRTVTISLAKTVKEEKPDNDVIVGQRAPGIYRRGPNARGQVRTNKEAEAPKTTPSPYSQSTAYDEQSPYMGSYQYRGQQTFDSPFVPSRIKPSSGAPRQESTSSPAPSSYQNPYQAPTYYSRPTSAPEPPPEYRPVSKYQVSYSTPSREPQRPGESAQNDFRPIYPDDSYPSPPTRRPQGRPPYRPEPQGTREWHSSAVPEYTSRPRVRGQHQLEMMPSEHSFHYEDQPEITRLPQESGDHERFRPGSSMAFRPSENIRHFVDADFEPEVAASSFRPVQVPHPKPPPPPPTGNNSDVKGYIVLVSPRMLHREPPSSMMDFRMSRSRNKRQTFLGGGNPLYQAGIRPYLGSLTQGLSGSLGGTSQLYFPEQPSSTRFQLPSPLAIPPNPLLQQTSGEYNGNPNHVNRIVLSSPHSRQSYHGGQQPQFLRPQSFQQQSGSPYQQRPPHQQSSIANIPLLVGYPLTIPNLQTIQGLQSPETGGEGGGGSGAFNRPGFVQGHTLHGGGGLGSSPGTGGHQVAPQAYDRPPPYSERLQPQGPSFPGQNPFEVPQYPQRGRPRQSQPPPGSVPSYGFGYNPYQVAPLGGGRPAPIPRPVPRPIPPQSSEDEDEEEGRQGRRPTSGRPQPPRGQGDGSREEYDNRRQPPSRDYDRRPTPPRDYDDRRPPPREYDDRRPPTRDYEDDRGPSRDYDDRRPPPRDYEDRRPLPRDYEEAYRRRPPPPDEDDDDGSSEERRRPPYTEDNDSRGRPDDSRGRPDDSRGRPEDTRGRPDDTRVRPDDTRGRPDDTRGRPDDSRSRPDDSRSRPDDRRRPPKGEDEDDDRPNRHRPSDGDYDNRGRRPPSDDDSGPKPDDDESYALSNSTRKNPPPFDFSDDFFRGPSVGLFGPGAENRTVENVTESFKPYGSFGFEDEDAGLRYKPPPHHSIPYAGPYEPPKPAEGGSDPTGGLRGGGSGRPGPDAPVIGMSAPPSNTPPASNVRPKAARPSPASAPTTTASAPPTQSGQAAEVKTGQPGSPNYGGRLRPLTPQRPLLRPKTKQEIGLPKVSTEQSSSSNTFTYKRVSSTPGAMEETVPDGRKVYHAAGGTMSDSSKPSVRPKLFAFGKPKSGTSTTSEITPDGTEVHYVTDPRTPGYEPSDGLMAQESSLDRHRYDYDRPTQTSNYRGLSKTFYETNDVTTAYPYPTLFQGYSYHERPMHMTTNPTLDMGYTKAVTWADQYYSKGPARKPSQFASFISGYNYGTSTSDWTTYKEQPKVVESRPSVKYSIGVSKSSQETSTLPLDSHKVDKPSTISYVNRFLKPESTTPAPSMNRFLKAEATSSAPSVASVPTLSLFKPREKVKTDTWASSLLKNHRMTDENVTSITELPPTEDPWAAIIKSMEEKMARPNKDTFGVPLAWTPVTWSTVTTEATTPETTTSTEAPLTPSSSSWMSLFKTGVTFQEKPNESTTESKIESFEWSTVPPVSPKTKTSAVTEETKTMPVTVPPIKVTVPPIQEWSALKLAPGKYGVTTRVTSSVVTSDNEKKIQLGPHQASTDRPIKTMDDLLRYPKTMDEMVNAKSRDFAGFASKDLSPIWPGSTSGSSLSATSSSVDIRPVYRATTATSSPPSTAQSSQVPALPEDRLSITTSSTTTTTTTTTEAPSVQDIDLMTALAQADNLVAESVVRIVATHAPSGMVAQELTKFR